VCPKGCLVNLGKSQNRAVDVLRFDRLVQFVAVAMGLKALLVRRMVLGHALGIGAIADLVFIFGVVALLSLRGGRGARRGVAVADLLYSLVCVAVTVYASYFGQLPSLQTLALWGQADSLGSAAASLLSWSHLLLIIDLPVVLWLGFRRDDTAADPHEVQLLFGASSMLLVGVFSVTAMFSTIPPGNLEGSYAYGMVPYQVATLVREQIAARTQLPPAAKFQAKIDGMTGRDFSGRKPDAPKAGAYKGSNLIMIQVETLQASLVGTRVEGKPIVPNLEALIGRSYYYPNTYSQIGPGNTSDAEFIANTSLYPSQEMASSLKYSMKEIPGLPRLLGNMGYTTTTLHTNSANYWNRFQLYPALGFSDFADRTFFGDADIVGYGPSDAVLYAKTLPVIVSQTAEGKRVYAHVVTLTSHFPYGGGLSARAPLTLSKPVADTVTGRYFIAQSYADQQLGDFIKQLDQNGLMDNSVVVVYGDHFGMRFSGITDEDRRIRAQLLGRAYNRADFYSIPLVVHVPKQTTPVRDPDVMGQIDIMPTVADLLGVDLTRVPHFGRSAFVKTPTLLTRPSSIPTYIDNQIVYLGGITKGEDRWYSSTNQQMILSGVQPPRLADTRDLLNLSDAYVMSLPGRKAATEATGFVPTLGIDVSGTPYK
jgi:lipoteichoic acid synthase